MIGGELHGARPAWKGSTVSICGEDNCGFDLGRYCTFWKRDDTGVRSPTQKAVNGGFAQYGARLGAHRVEETIEFLSVSDFQIEPVEFEGIDIPPAPTAASVPLDRAGQALLRSTARGE